MYRYFLVDFILFLGATSTFLLLPLRNEFIYQRVAEKHEYNKSGQSFCGPNGTAPNQTDEDRVVADEVSRWTMLIDLSIFMPAIVVGALLTSWGDKVGRKVTMMIPLIGMGSSSVVQALVIQFHWPLTAMYAYSFLAGFTGYYMTLLMQGTAYLSDVTEIGKKSQRFTIVETFMGVGGGIAGISGGYWIKAQGFAPVVWATVGMAVLALMALPFLPNSLKLKKEEEEEEEDNKKRETRERSANSSNESINSGSGDRSNYGALDGRRAKRDSGFDSVSLQSEKDELEEVAKTSYKFSDLWKAVWRVYTTEYLTCDKCFGPNPDIASLPRDKKCKHGGGIVTGRVWRLWLYLVSYCCYMFVNVGTVVFQTMFFLAHPLCFTPVLVGAQLSTKYAGVVTGPFFVYFFQRFLNLGNQAIIMISLLGFFATPLIMSFATEPYIVFIATSTMTIGCIAKPFIQAQISQLASESEQGAAFSLLSSAEVLSFLLATVSYLTLYPATQYISHWFCWMFSAAVVLIPIAFVGVIWIADMRKESNGSGQSTPLLRSDSVFE